MRNTKERWAFYKMPHRPELSAADVIFWRNQLSRILKVGFELEFNLPEKKNGTCKGESTTCPCKHLKPENECWQKCINTEGCHAIERNMELCKNAAINCEVEDCAGCEHFSAECTGIYCSNFISYCYVCEKFERECTGCQFRYDPDKNPDAIRKHITQKFQPTNTYGVIGASGVHSVVQDGSLLGKKGAEVVTIGRRVDYWEFFKMLKRIIDETVGRGGYVNERCSTHMHLLGSYYGKMMSMGGNDKNSGVPNRVNEMERDMPEIILANFHQLCRRYQNAITWMCMGLDEPERLTRWEKFRVSILEISAVKDTMQNVLKQVSNNAGGNKYGWMNYNPVEFTGNGDVRRFHVEARTADGLLSPSALAALGCMFYALAIKAVEISRYGLLEVGDESWMNQARQVKDAILNNMKGYQDGDRFGDTRHLHKYYEILQSEATDLVQQLKNILIRIGPAYDVLERLAERPCALRRVDGDTWEQIEKDLEVKVGEEGRLEIALSEIITLNQVTECQHVEEWIATVGQMLRQDPEMGIDPDNAVLEEQIEEYVVGKRENGELVWSGRIGSPIII